MMDGALLHGWSGLAIAYAAVQGPMIAGLISRRAPLSQYLLSPLVAVPLTAIAGAGTAIVGSLLHGAGMASHSVLQLAFGAALSVAVGYAGGRRGEPGTGIERIRERGTIVAETVNTRPARGVGRARGAEITLAGIAVPSQDETKHFKLIGTTGTGKSTAIGELLGGALTRGDRAVIADPDGGYARRFYVPARGDVILNPFEPNAVKWDLFAEIETAYDVEQLARSLIPDHEGSDRSWRGYARTFFTAVTRQAHEVGIRDVAELYRLLVVADTDELRGLLRGTPAQPFLTEHGGAMFNSIRSVTSSAVDALDHVAQQKGTAFGVRQWVRSEAPGALFIPYKAGQIAALRSTISAWMRLAIFETMNRGEPGADEDQGRLWFVVDELDALGQIDGLKDALARLRKFGGRCVLGFQSVAQVSSTYGHGEAHTIVENCGNTVILRCSASEGGGTARFASQLIGEREVLRTTISTNRRFNEFVGSKTQSEHYSIEPALLPSQIEQLPDLEGYLKFASSATWRRVSLVPSAANIQASAFGEAAPSATAPSAVAVAPLPPLPRASGARQVREQSHSLARDGLDYE